MAKYTPARYKQVVRGFFDRLITFFNRSKVTKKDMAIMDSRSDIELADMANKLNCWLWPEQLPDEDVDHYTENSRRSQLMNYIEGKVGKKLINRRWNKDRMTDLEHEKFWNDRCDR
ncbi:hypothetical protein [Candidatus Enterovibrio escicola]|uniref:hypothetical protein n=1 Tax=Candidatus Enterovibrio escicola TaxID=1927127 RepID=UPI001237FAC7|nr:hypothetical protein [Candidatus Enterovibrio escacola]